MTHRVGRYTLAPGWHPVLVPNGATEVSWKSDTAIRLGPLNGTMAIVEGTEGRGHVDTSEILGIYTQEQACVCLVWH